MVDEFQYLYLIVIHVLITSGDSSPCCRNKSFFKLDLKLLKERKWYVQHNYLLLCVVHS